MCFLCLLFVCLFCVYVCVDFFGGWVGAFLTGGGCVVPGSCTRQEFNKNVVACVVCYSSLYLEM